MSKARSLLNLLEKDMEKVISDLIPKTLPRMFRSVIPGWTNINNNVKYREIDKQTYDDIVSYIEDSDTPIHVNGLWVTTYLDNEHHLDNSDDVKILDNNKYYLIFSKNKWNIKNVFLYSPEDVELDKEDKEGFDKSSKLIAERLKKLLTDNGFSNVRGDIGVVSSDPSRPYIKYGRPGDGRISGDVGFYQVDIVVENLVESIYIQSASLDGIDGELVKFLDLAIKDEEMEFSDDNIKSLFDLLQKRNEIIKTSWEAVSSLPTIDGLNKYD